MKLWKQWRMQAQQNQHEADRWQRQALAYREALGKIAGLSLDPLYPIADANLKRVVRDAKAALDWHGRTPETGEWPTNKAAPAGSGDYTVHGLDNALRRDVLPEGESQVPPMFARGPYQWAEAGGGSTTETGTTIYSDAEAKAFEPCDCASCRAEAKVVFFTTAASALPYAFKDPAGELSHMPSGEEFPADWGPAEATP